MQSRQTAEKTPRPPSVAVQADGRILLGGYFSSVGGTAKLQVGAGGVSSSSDAALYGVGTDGALRQLIGEGQPLDGKTVRSFNVLKASIGSVGVTRSFNNRSTIAALVTYTDGGTATVVIAFPSLFD